MTVTPAHFVGLAFIIFAIGFLVVVVRKNAIAILMGVELMLNAVNLILLAFNRIHGTMELDGQVFAIFVIAVAAAEAVVGLALILAVYRSLGTVSIDDLNALKG